MLRMALLLICAAAPAFANPTVDAARAAQARLQEAHTQLKAAHQSRDRIRALTTTIRAYEDGLVAMRDGIRRAALREAQLNRELDTKSEEIAQLLAALQAMERAPAPLLLLHPSGPLGTARSGMIVSDVAPALQAEAETLKVQLNEVAQLREIQDSAAQTLDEGLDGAQAARTALSRAMGERTDLPPRLAEDPVQAALLIASATTLEDFANGLAQTSAAPEGPSASALRGTLPPPVSGAVVQRFGESGAQRSEGLSLATRARALVTTPGAATVRFTGALLDYGNVVILEPAVDVLIVLAGLGELFVQPGEVLAPGAPIGLMDGVPPSSQGILSDETGLDRPETLYIEVRESGQPVDPALWFVLE